jgi:23S rRNA pseudouridine1911/1915/1917 synthase
MTATDQSAGITAVDIAADARDAGLRLDRLLAASGAGLSRMRVKALILDGRVTRNGETVVDPSYRVKPGDRFRVDVPASDPPLAIAQEIPLDIRFEDEQVIVIDKPPGLVVHPAPGNPDRTLVNALIHHCGPSLSGIGGVRRPGIVHRLDRDTSGLIVAAKTNVAHESLSRQFADRTIDRAYTAVVWGCPSPRQGMIDRPIGRSPRNRKKMAVVEGGKPARTRYRTLDLLTHGASVVECRLETGRTHQIRVHMAYLGHAIVGDPAYGGQPRQHSRPEQARAAARALGRQALHARLLGFVHPTTGARIRIESELPIDINELIDVLNDGSEPPFRSSVGSGGQGTGEHDLDTISD